MSSSVVRESSAVRCSWPLTLSVSSSGSRGLPYGLDPARRRRPACAQPRGSRGRNACHQELSPVGPGIRALGLTNLGGHDHPAASRRPLAQRIWFNSQGWRQFRALVPILESRGPSSLSDSRDKRSNLETNGIDERIFQQRNSSLLAISIFLFHLLVKSDRLLDFVAGNLMARAAFLLLALQ